jgi:hypothetical protein
MSQDVKPTSHDLDIAFQGVYNQIEAHGLKDLYLSEAGLFKFVQHIAEVIATERAYSDFLNKCLQEGK